MPGKNNKRPRHLDLLHIRLPVGGVVSILHRVTGVLLVALLPLAMWLLQQSLTSAAGYARVAELLCAWPLRLALFLATLALAHHFFAGVRHLLLDLDIGIDRAGGRRGAWTVFAALAVTALVSAAGLFL
jgi:succinate dehydrogenase / fumarate reductase cytochrome b subunit